MGTRKGLWSVYKSYKRKEALTGTRHTRTNPSPDQILLDLCPVQPTQWGLNWLRGTHSHWFRYVDDIWDPGKSPSIHDHINAVDGNIKFTREDAVN